MGFNMHFYIIFLTNLLTEGPVKIAVFLPIQVFRRKGISNGTKPSRGSFFGTNAIQETWSGGQGSNKVSTR